MTYSFVQRSGSAFTDAAMKKLQLDPLVVDGSQFRYDFLSPYSNPNPDGVLANGTTFKNLVENNGDATYTLQNQGFSVAAGKKGLVCPGTDTNNTSFLQTPVGAYDAHTETGDHNFIWHVWCKETTGYQGSGDRIFSDRIFIGETSAIWGATPGAAITDGAAGAGSSPSAYLRAGGVANALPAVPADSLLNAAHLLSFAYESGTVKLLVDGALFSSAAWAFANFGLPSRRSHGSLVFAANPAAGSTVTINGNAITFVAAGAAGAQVNIGADATATAQALKTYVNANKVALGATAEGPTTTLAIIQRATSTTLTLASGSANVTVGAVVAPKGIRLVNHMKGEFYAVAGEDLTASGRTALASAQAEFAGYRPKLVAAGLAV